MRLAALVLLVVTTGTEAGAAVCPAQPASDFERQGYTIRRARVAGFWLLARALAPPSGASTPLDATPFSEAAVLAYRNVLRARIIRLPMPFDSPISATVVAAPRLVNCDTSAHQLDVEYPVFTTKIPLAGLRTPEAANLSSRDPRRALGLGSAPSRLAVAPVAGYDASQHFWAGGRLHTAWRATKFEVEGQASEEGGHASSSFSGGRTSDRGRIREMTWRAGAAYEGRPAGAIDLRSRRVQGQFGVATAPLGPHGVSFRAGTLVEGGHQEATALEAAPAPQPGALTVADSRFLNWRSYAGIALRTRGHTFAASYGLLLGHTGAGALVDYRKHIADLAHDLRIPAGTRRALEVGSRLTAGTLSSRGPTPVGERFFGGNVETQFVPGSEWVIRANPVLRGIPAYRLNRPSAASSGVGIDRFVVLNLTIGIPVVAVPLIPREASTNPELRKAVDDLMDSGVEVLQVLEELDDPAQLELFNTRRQGLAETTAAMEARVQGLDASVPATLRRAYDACVDKIGDLAAAAADIRRSTPWRMFVNPDPQERGIPVVDQLCFAEFNAVLGDQELNLLGDELREHARVIAAQLAKIDRPAAHRSAQEEMNFPRTVVRKVFDEMTVLSVTPLIAVDAGRVANSSGPSAFRYSLGAGIRLTVASAVMFDVGYSRNMKPLPGEGTGALFVAMRFVDLFGR